MSDYGFSSWLPGPTRSCIDCPRSPTRSQSGSHMAPLAPALLHSYPIFIGYEYEWLWKPFTVSLYLAACKIQGDTLHNLVLLTNGFLMQFTSNNPPFERLNGKVFFCASVESTSTWANSDDKPEQIRNRSRHMDVYILLAGFDGKGTIFLPFLFVWSSTETSFFFNGSFSACASIICFTSIAGSFKSFAITM